MGEMTIGGFIARLAAAAVAMESAQRSALERAAKVIEAEAKAEIGEYQGAAGPFAAWAPLADATKKDRVAQGYSEDDPLLRTGGLRDSISHAVARDEAVIGSNSEIAVYQELGTATIPPRSFLGGAAVRKTAEVVKILGSAPVAALLGPGSAQRLP